MTEDKGVHMTGLLTSMLDTMASVEKKTAEVEEESMSRRAPMVRYTIESMAVEYIRICCMYADGVGMDETSYVDLLTMAKMMGPYHRTRASHLLSYARDELVVTDEQFKINSRNQ